MSRRRRVVIAVSAAVVALAAGVLVLCNRATRPTSQGGPR